MSEEIPVLQLGDKIRIPIDAKWDDIYLLTLAGFMALVLYWLGAKEVASNVASGTAGAIFMYVKGK
jgi:hypothetical protein